jgi:DNA-binding beta-propeller fold protein YncE
VHSRRRQCLGAAVAPGYDSVVARLSWLSLLVAVAAASACGGRHGLKSGAAGAGAAGSAAGAAGAGEAGAGVAGAAGAGGAADAGLDAGAAAIEVSGPAPGAFMLTSPVSKPDEQATPILTWQASEGAVTFDVEISTTETFSDATTQRMSGLTALTSSLPAPIAPAVVHFWRVTAVGPGGARTVAANAPAWFATPFDDSHGPYALALTANNKLLVLDRGTPVGLTILDLATSTVTAVPTGGTDARALAVTSDGKRAYLSEVGHYRVFQIDLESDAAATILPSTVDKLIYGLAVTPDGSTLVAPFSDSLLGEDVLALIPLRDGVTARSIRLGSQQQPYTVALTPDGASAIVNIGGISHVDLASGTFTKIPDAGGDGVAVTGDGRTAWTTVYTDGVREVDLTSNTRRRVIPFSAGGDQCGIAVSPDGTRAVVWKELRVNVALPGSNHHRDRFGGALARRRPLQDPTLHQDTVRPRRRDAHELALLTQPRDVRPS